ncbi:MAG: hypothetical protein RL308_3013 [Bacteroidota bacterium]|jgi:hypothetical protein
MDSNLKTFFVITFLVNSIGSVLLFFHFSNKITIELIWIKFIIILSIIFNLNSLLRLIRQNKQ